MTQNWAPSSHLISPGIPCSPFPSALRGKSHSLWSHSGQVTAGEAQAEVTNGGVQAGSGCSRFFFFFLFLAFLPFPPDTD